MSKASRQNAGAALRGLAFLGIIGAAAGSAGAKTESAPPPKQAAAPAPAHPAARQGNVAAGQRPQINQANRVNNGQHPAPNSITTNHYPGPVVRRQQQGEGRQPHPPCCDRGPVRPGPHTAPNGIVYSTDAHGALTHTYDPKTGMNIDHRPGGRTVSTIDREPGHRTVAYRGGGYDGRTYSFRGQQFEHRTYLDHGRTYERIYSPYAYHGVRMEAYRPSLYYSAGFYHWAGRPWPQPVHYGWGWASDPWYSYYGPYFVPAPAYGDPALWLTDYVIAANLQAAYAQNAELQTNYGPPSGATPLTPEVKQQISAEVQYQMQQENAEAQANAHGQLPSGPVGVSALFIGNQTHVFVAGADLNLTDLSGRQCQITQGDVLQVRAPPAGNSTFVTATVLGSKGGADCAVAANVNVGLSDLQDMQNHMRETADEGMRELQAKQGQGGLPAAPADATTPAVSGAFVDAAPAPDPQAGNVILAQANAAEQSERSLQLSPPSTPVAQSPAPTISAGEPIAQVVTSMGNPATIVNLGAKQVYIYKNPGMKVIFVNGKVTDIE